MHIPFSIAHYILAVLATVAVLTIGRGCFQTILNDGHVLTDRKHSLLSLGFLAVVLLAIWVP